MSAILEDGSILEALHRPDDEETLFCVFREGETRYEAAVTSNGQRLVPYSASNNLLTNDPARR
jgi:hypothetical protein